MEDFRPVLWVSLLLAIGVEAGPGKNLVVVVFSGLRQSDLTASKTPTLAKIRENGVVSTVRSVFPGETFPNQYSMLTGLAPSVHGVVWDRMVDEGTGDIIDAADPPETLLLGGELIWTTASRENVRTGIFTSGNFKSGGLLTAPCESCNAYNIVDQMVHWISSAIGADSEGSTFSFVAFPAKAASDVDSIAERLMEKLKEAHVSDAVNIIFTGDHGLAVRRRRIPVCLSDILHGKSYEIVDHTGGSVSLRPSVNESEVTLLQELAKVKGIVVHPYLEFIQKYQLTGSMRVAPITLLAANDSYVIEAENCRGGEDSSVRSLSGYVRRGTTAFLAMGPQFASGVQAPAMDITDIYQVVCAILELGGGHCLHDESESLKSLLATTPVVSSSLYESSVGDVSTVTKGTVVMNSGHREIGGVGILFVILAGIGFLGGIFWLSNFFAERRQRHPGGGYKLVDALEPDLSLRTRPLLGSGDSDDFGRDSVQMTVLKDKSPYQLMDDDDEDDDCSDDDAPPRVFPPRVFSSH